MGKWFWFSSGAACAGALVAAWFGHSRESAKAANLAAALGQQASRSAAETVDFASLSALPAPVARYFRHVLKDGQKIIRRVEMRQTGVLRTSTTSKIWSPFKASQLVVPPARGFLWNARVHMPLATHVRVVDSYLDGAGAGRVSLLSAFALAAETAVPELNSGALHRYLAEAVWYPTALLPQSGVAWSAVDDRTALATLADKETKVSLEFRFNEALEVAGIFSPGRYSRWQGGYRQLPWEGHFADYHVSAGMLVPRRGEVGWYQSGSLQLVWQGTLMVAQVEF
jgi:hypothetical protein